jgi:ATP-dependent RNA helicase DeaD
MTTSRDTDDTPAEPPADAQAASTEQQAPNFADLGIDERVLQSLSDAGYETPTPIQAATIPPLLDGRHVVGLAQTGTGKTAAFAVPILSELNLGSDAQRTPQALVLAPTRELALQVAEAFTRYAHHLPGVKVLPIYGGQAYQVQMTGLRRGAQVIVGTPGRVIDLLEKKALDLSELRFLVLDEADEMLRMGFQEDVETILAQTPDTKQVALFSATMPPQIRRISKRYLTDAVEITVATKTVTAAATRQRYIQVGYNQKLDALTRILEIESGDAMIVFVRTKQATEDLAERLRARGYGAAAINGDLAQNQRERTIEQLRNGSLDILVATDVAARGLDVDRISHVVNYDIPHDTESYIHRIGRTGRAGRSGDALLFVTPRERHLLSAIERATRQSITEIPLPSVDEVNTTRLVKFADSITEALEAPDAAFFRSLIETYEQDRNVPAIDIAAALASLMQKSESFLLEPDPPAPERAPRKAYDREPSRVSDTPAHGAPRVAGPRRPRAEASGGPLAKYRIRVGRRHKVHPGAIVGAIANEGGLRREDFGHIDIQADHTTVELPADLSAATLDALKRTRISGQLIELTRDDDAGPATPHRAHRGSTPGAKPATTGKPFKAKKPRW